MRMTLQEVLETTNNWDLFCEDKGFCVYAVNEGGGNVEVSLSIEEARKYGILNSSQ